MRNSLNTLAALAGTALFLVSSEVSPAAVATTYTSSDDFNAAVLPGYYLETFDSLVPAPPVYESLPSFSLNGFAYDITTGDGNVNTSSFYPIVSPYDSSDIWLAPNSGDGVITITLTSNNVTAIGGSFFLTNGPGFPISTVSMDVLLNDGSEIILGPSDSFAGFTSTVPILSLKFFPLATNDGAEYLTINNLIVGQAVPEPSTGLSLAFGLIVLAAGSRFLKKSRRSTTNAV